MMKSGIVLTSVVGTIALASSAQAGLIVETESNNTLATANNIGTFNVPGGSILVDGTITPGTPVAGGGFIGGDVDWFQFTVSGPAQLVSATFGVPNSAIGDSVLSLYDAGGTLLAQDDDSGINSFSALESILGAGTYYLVVTGFPDFNNVGAHGESFNYKMTVGTNVTPAPGALALLGVAGLVGRRRRRA